MTDELFAKASPTEVEWGYVWGRTVKGLRAAVEFVPEKESYIAGEQVGVRFHIENVSGDYVQIYSLKRREDIVIAKDARGRRVDVTAVTPSTGGPGLHRAMWPGSTKVFASCGLGFGHIDDAALYGNEESGEYWKGNVLRCGPGEYSISYRLGLSETVCSLDGKKCITYPGDWKGTLVPGARMVIIVPRETSD